MCEVEKDLLGQIEELKREYQSLDYVLVDDAEVEEVYIIKDIKNNAVLELGCVGPHSKYFSILCLDGDKEIETLERCLDEEQDPYILKFSTPKRQSDIPHLRAKKCKMRYLLLGSFIFTPPPHERDRKIDKTLEVQFISSKWKKKW